MYIRIVKICLLNRWTLTLLGIFTTMVIKKNNTNKNIYVSIAIIKMRLLHLFKHFKAKFTFFYTQLFYYINSK